MRVGGAVCDERDINGKETGPLRGIAMVCVHSKC